MRLTKERIFSVSKSILDRLLHEELCVIQTPKEELVRRIERVISNELMVEDRLNEEVREILKGYQTEIDQGDVDYRKMFLMIKSKLVKERGIIL
jgi:hypothetical protein